MRQFVIHEPKKTIPYGELIDNFISQDYTGRKDVVVDSRNIRAVAVDGGIMLSFPPGEGLESVPFELTDWAHTQLSQKMNIPKKYYDRMRESGKANLLADNVNAWMQTSEQRMLRTMKGAVRAIVSDRYLRIDNAFALKILKDKCDSVGLSLHDTSVVKRCHLSDTKMSIQINVPFQTEEIVKGDRVVQGLILSNSEVGASAFTVEPFLYRLVCSNGLISPQSLTRIHLGSRNELGELESITTNNLENELLKSKMSDIVESVFNEEVFHKWVDQLRETTEVSIPSPTKTLDMAFDAYNLLDELKPKVMDEMLREGDNTQYGLVNALTAVAKEMPNFEDMITIERVAGEISVMQEQQFVRKLVTV